MDTLTSSRPRPETISRPAVELVARPSVRGKFLFRGDRKLLVRGVTYGTFRPREDGGEFPVAETVRKDFAAMAANGVNTVRVYTPPPRWLLDEARRNGLLVLVGLPWEQHVAFLGDRRQAADIVARVREGARECAGHPALLGFAVGNEIPASIVRWHGRRPVERFIRKLYDSVKQEDPEALVTYVNFPTTEYLTLPFLDFQCFNVYLESRETLAAYLARLQTLAADKPLLMAEVGLDSARNGKIRQAEVLDWQIETVFAAGCCGVFVFAWTDEWHRGGYDVEDWDFGLTDRQRKPKPALFAVRAAFSDPLRTAARTWPRISAVVCTRNGSRTLGECLEHLTKLPYPDYEVIVVDDGSTDRSSETAALYDVRLIRVPNGGLSRARNLGAEAATGEIVAYIDDDAYPDEHWLHYLALAYMENPKHAGVGGPNLAPPGDGLVAEAVAYSPGNPLHVMLSDREAEHIPGCNSSFRRDRLRSIGGFDPTFRVAGDDVDFCWRLLEKGWTIGFHPGAMVWHHRRNSIRTYWKQQRGYGKAEALLERKHPGKYSQFGHIAWAGRVYGNGLIRNPGRWRVYHGCWGSAAFQPLYQPAAKGIGILTRMPEWYLVTTLLGAFAALGLAWKPLLAFVPVFAAAVWISLVQVLRGASQAISNGGKRPAWRRWSLFALTAAFHALQPAARLWGRLHYGLSPWRGRGGRGFVFPRPRVSNVWSERWRSPEEWLRGVEANLKADGATVIRGGGWDRWDLEVLGGWLGAIRIRMAVEEHGAGKQLLRFRVWPRVPALTLLLAAGTVILSAAAALAGESMVASAVAAVGLVLGGRALSECGGAAAGAVRAIKGGGVHAEP